MAWGLWDWGTQPFATVITTFVFSVYLTSGKLFGTGPDDETPSLQLGWAMAVAGLFIALLAPVLGQGSDRSGKRMFNLRWQTAALAVLSACLWFVSPEPQFLILGLVLLGVGNVIAEIANVNYYASLDQVATPSNVGRVSGIGWGMGYLGGIAILLLIVALRGADFTPDDVRFAMLVCGAWMALFCIPIFVAIRDRRPAPSDVAPGVGILGAYRELFASIRRIYRSSPHTIYFLLASALFRDGLAGVFTFGAVLAAGTFGFSFGQVIIFGIAANVTAGVATMLFGLLDDKLGPRRVILIALGSLVLLGGLIFVFHDGGAGVFSALGLGIAPFGKTTVFWVLGLALTLFVGPAQSASRSFLARATPQGKAGEMFGLYATTGRAVSFLSPLAWSGSILLGRQVVGEGQSAQYFGILGIVVVLALGFIVMLFVKEGGHSFDGAPEPARADG